MNWTGQKLLASAVVVIMNLSWPLVAQAQLNEDAASRLGKQAHALYKNGHYWEAVQKLRRALDYHKHERYYYNLARCYEKLGQLELSLLNYESAMALSPPPKYRGRIETAIATLRGRLGATNSEVLVTAEPHDAMLYVDGKMERLPFRYWLPFGKHTIRLVAKNHKPLETVVTVQPHQKLNRHFRLKSLKAGLSLTFLYSRSQYQLPHLKATVILLDGGIENVTNLTFAKCQAQVCSTDFYLVAEYKGKPVRISFGDLRRLECVGYCETTPCQVKLSLLPKKERKGRFADELPDEIVAKAQFQGVAYPLRQTPVDQQPLNQFRAAQAIKLISIFGVGPMKCPVDGAIFPPEAKYCPYHGVKLVPK